jgi:hypothetical protein
MDVVTGMDQAPDAAAREPQAAEASRRKLLTGVGTGAVLAAFGARFAQAATRQPAGRAGLPPPPGPPASATLRFLVERTTYGWTPEVWARAQQLGYEGFLEEQLAYAGIPENPALVNMLAQFPTLGMTSKQIYDTYFGPQATQPNSVPINELKSASVLRAAYSTRQLYERMVEFWSDHFSVDHGDGQVRWLKTTEDRDVIRVHALGNFKDLLLADARSAAMLYYLDNNANLASAPNENYARELLELHTMDVGNYTEADVFAIARCFTGWQYWNTSQANHGDFRFNAAQHDNGPKVFLGVSLPAGGGVSDGETVIDLLAHHPATAQFVCRKLARWLLGYEPTQPVVDSAARYFLATGGDIKSVVRSLLSPDSVERMPTSGLPKIKRPFHLLASLVRATNPTLTQLTRFVSELTSMGHTPFAWSSPDGYPDSAATWGSSVLPRWNFVTRYCGNSIPGVSVDIATLFAGIPKSGLAARANELLTGGTLAPEDVAAVQAYADGVVTLNDTLRRDVLALSAQSPSFQYY